ncbi:hypothetical protein GCM10023097_61370 [Streptomyces collinus]
MRAGSGADSAGSEKQPEDLSRVHRIPVPVRCPDRQGGDAREAPVVVDEASVPVGRPWQPPGAGFGGPSEHRFTDGLPLSGGE